jgi:NitT/TauT family transport system ATP-binding protein
MSARLTTRDLVMAYPQPGGASLLVLGPLSVEIERGSFVCLIGPSGCGKSTLIRILAGLQSPSCGQAFLDGQIIQKPSRRVGLMFQDSNLMPWRSVLDNIALPLELQGIGVAERHHMVRALLPRLGLSIEFAEAVPAELSGGMAQRVALGRVLIQQPDVLLLDEPFGALDSLTREQVAVDLMKMWATAAPTILMVTHNINEAVLLADRILVLSSRPAQLVADISVTLPRPRHLSDVYSDYFGEMALAVRQALRL